MTPLASWCMVAAIVGTVVWLIREFAHAEDGDDWIDPRMEFGPVQACVRSGDYTHDELEALRPFPVCDWPAAMEQIRAAEREARLEADVLDDDAFVAAVVRGWEK